MKIDVKIDTRGLEARTLREAKRLAFNTAEALNNTAKAAQKDIRDRMQGVFKIRATTKRDRKWLLEQVKIAFASVKKGVIYAEVYIAQRERLLLGGFETGEQRKGFVGENSASPNPKHARVGGQFAGALKPDLAFKKLKLKKVHVVPRTRPDRTQFKGAARTFMLKSSLQNPQGGVYQRVGPKRDDIRLIYSFMRVFKLRKILKFLETSGRTMKDKFKVEWTISNARNQK